MTSDTLYQTPLRTTCRPPAGRQRLEKPMLSPRTLTTLLVALAVLLTSTVSARAPLPEREQRLSLLTLLGRHHFEVERKVFDRIGPAREIVDHLVLFVGDPKLRPTIRQRAIASLRVYPGTRVQKVLETLLYDPDLRDRPGTVLRREAMRSLAIAFRDGAIIALSNHREDANPQIREGCAHALGLTRSTHALTLLDAWLPHEPELFVRLAVDNAIAHIRGHATR
jgi:HEAT repeat protein